MKSCWVVVGRPKKHELDSSKVEVEQDTQKTEHKNTSQRHRLFGVFLDSCIARSPILLSYPRLPPWLSMKHAEAAGVENRATFSRFTAHARSTCAVTALRRGSWHALACAHLFARIQTLIYCQTPWSVGHEAEVSNSSCRVMQSCRLDHWQLIYRIPSLYCWFMCSC
jgi:hypothetical protein